MKFKFVYLVFKYRQGEHNVYKVKARSYASSTVSAPHTSLKSGNNDVNYMTRGEKVYVCGVSIDCPFSTKS